MRKMMMAAAAMAILVAGCGSSDDEATPTTEAAPTTDASPEAQAWIDAFTTSFSTGETDQGALVLDEAQATCVAEGWVGIIGVDELEASDFTVEEAADPYGDIEGLAVDEETARSMVDVFGDCGVDLVAEVAASLTAGGTDEQRACAEENIELEAVEELLVVTFQGGGGDEEFDAIYEGVLEACGDL
jgi:hypothetical protein